MSHARTQLRELIAAQVTGLATTGARVFQSRTFPQVVTEPLLLVQTNGEDVQPADIGHMQERTLEVFISGFAQATSNVDDTLDQIALEVEQALANNTRATLASVNVEFDDSLQQPLGRIDLRYRVRYFVLAASPNTLIME